jgi:peptidoglycan/LPS O-acetylase OafA/YrhL
MNKLFSAYLDSTRLFAALVVFFGHITFVDSTSIFSAIQLADYGNDAVMIFFVLSGFVIGYVSKTKESDINVYISSRVSRLFSIVWPALILTIVLDQIGRYFTGDVYNNAWWYQDTFPALRFFANSVLLNQVWFLEIRPFSNGPFWSLGYELWFYVLFIPIGFAINHRGYILGGLCLLAGPRILLLYPTWLIGYYLYLNINKFKLTVSTSLLLIFSSLLIYFLYRLNFGESGFTKRIIGEDDVFNLGRSSVFLDNYFVAVLVFLHFLGIYNLLRTLDENIIPKKIYILNKLMASSTFAIYAIHYPIIFFISSLTMQNSFIVSASLIIFPIIFAGLITYFGGIIRRPIYLLVDKIQRIKIT